MGVELHSRFSVVSPVVRTCLGFTNRLAFQITAKCQIRNILRPISLLYFAQQMTRLSKESSCVVLYLQLRMAYVDTAERMKTFFVPVVGCFGVLFGGGKSFLAHKHPWFSWRGGDTCVLRPMGMLLACACARARHGWNGRRSRSALA